MTFASTQATWAAAVAAALEAGGVSDIVVSPGSRSTPLVLALCAGGAIRIVPVGDERSAAFFALGLARRLERPSALLCTSGTAGAHYLPALIEASETGVPLIAITADRPPELQGRGANQTIDQRALFGGYARRSIDLGVADASSDGLRAVAGRVRRAVALTLHPEPGPVHLNAPFRKPLEPEGFSTGGPPPSLAPGPEERPGVVVADDDTVADLCALVRDSARGLIVAGPASLAMGRAADDVRELAAATGFALLAEATSQLRDGERTTRSGREVARCDGFDLVFGGPELRAELRPEVVIQLGRTPVSASFERLLRQSDGVRHLLLSSAGYFDTAATVGRVVRGELGDLCRRVSEGLVGHAPDLAYAGLLEAADAGAWSAVLEAMLERGDVLTEATVTRALVSELPDGGSLVVGNSLPVRDLDWFSPALPPGVGVLSQRGVSGIDGMVSGAAGVASATRLPTTLYVGDVSFLHDLQGLLAADQVAGTLVILVVNNDGGRIFERLPVAAASGASEDFERLWVMPHGRSPAAIASACGVRGVVAETLSGLRAELREAYQRGGVSVIEARIDRGLTGADHRRILPAAAAAAARGLPPNLVLE